jgi:ribonuclease BN (tRNA processing enzyme)
MTHIPPWFDKQELLAEAQSVWDGPVELARAGASYEL